MKFLVTVLSFLFICSFAKAEEAKGNEGSFIVGVESHVSQDDGFDENVGKQAKRGGNVLILGYTKPLTAGYSFVASTNWLPINNGYKVKTGDALVDVKSYRVSAGLSKEVFSLSNSTINVGGSLSHIRRYVFDTKIDSYNALSISTSLEFKRVGFMLSFTPKKLTTSDSAPNTITFAIGVKL
jgi:hypothetical protein